jgi:hypothetical protein
VFPQAVDRRMRLVDARSLGDTAVLRYLAR